MLLHYCTQTGINCGWPTGRVSNPCLSAVKDETQVNEKLHLKGENFRDFFQSTFSSVFATTTTTESKLLFSVRLRRNKIRKKTFFGL